MLQSIVSWLPVASLFFSLVLCGYAENNKPQTLSLEEAILLAVRENPHVQQAQLNDVVQKFALEVQQWQFQPHYAFQVSRTFGQNTTAGNSIISNTFNAQPELSLLTPVGTQIGLTSTNTVADHYNPSLSLQVIQPLMRGFGKPIVEAALYNARDSKKISQLNVEGTLRSTITAVIIAYLGVISADYTLAVDQLALQRAETSVEQTKLYIKAGRKAGVELVTVQADAASAKTRIEIDKNNVMQARYGLLTTIGINPHANIVVSHFDVSQLIKKYHIPSLTEAQKMILENDIQYQADEITLHGSLKRSVLTAEDNTRWQLNLTLNGTVGSGSGGGVNAGINSLGNGYNQSRSAAINLTVPIDNKMEQQALVNAKIALREAEIAIKQEKWEKETNAINGWNTLYSAERTLHFAEEAERLQQQTYNISFQKYTHGLIDSLELQSAQLQLRTAQQSLAAARIGYLQALVNLDQLVGTTLKTWGIKVRYA